MHYNIRIAKLEDLKSIKNIYAYARDFMERNGNPNQWGRRNPPIEQTLRDIAESKLYVLTQSDKIHGVFYFSIGEDPTYVKIYEGTWHWNTQYGTIHRIAGDGSGGILKSAVDYASEQIPHLRIDTHRDNSVMHRALHKLGFQKCGVIIIADGTERIAYDYMK